MYFDQRPGQKEVRESYRRVIQAEETGLKKRKLWALKDVYQKFKYYADEISFVGFCKMKIVMFLESYRSMLNSFGALFLQYERRGVSPSALGKILLILSQFNTLAKFRI